MLSRHCRHEHSSEIGVSAANVLTYLVINHEEVLSLKSVDNYPLFVAVFYVFDEAYGSLPSGDRVLDRQIPYANGIYVLPDDPSRGSVVFKAVHGGRLPISRCSLYHVQPDEFHEKFTS